MQSCTSVLLRQMGIIEEDKENAISGAFLSVIGESLITFFPSPKWLCLVGHFVDNQLAETVCRHRGHQRRQAQ